MAGTRSEADPDQLDQLARQMTAGAEQCAELARHGRDRVAHLPWYGPEADQFRQGWNTVQLRALLTCAEVLHKAAGALHTNAEEQRQASAAVGGALGMTFPGAPGGGGGGGGWGAGSGDTEGGGGFWDWVDAADEVLSNPWLEGAQAAWTLGSPFLLAAGPVGVGIYAAGTVVSRTLDVATLTVDGLQLIHAIGTNEGVPEALRDLAWDAATMLPVAEVVLAPVTLLKSADRIMGTGVTEVVEDAAADAIGWGLREVGEGFEGLGGLFKSWGNS